jgi:hypothetical protein
MRFLQNFKITKTLIVTMAIAVSGIGLLLHANTVHAVSATDFQPGHIIDDAVFYNSGSFASAQAVQDFITSHTPTCDTWGTQPSGYGNLNRAQYAQQVMGWPGPPYVCLQNYYENPSTGSTSYENGGGAFAGGESAGQIIYDAAQQYGINPEVLLVMLKKESPGPLFSDSWPLKSQYRYAMGYACPDSGPNYSAACVSSKAGFYNQMNLAAWQLRYYANNISQYNYQPGRSNYIQYSPDPNCGGTSVYIDNLATASLYIYTPYVPNQAALQAYPGTASCGAYGNRNFFMFFNEWFGSTYGAVNVTSPLTVTSGLSQGLFTNRTITAQFTLRNNSGQRQDIGTMAIATRDQNGTNYDFGSQHIVLDPWQTYTYQATRTLSNEGTYSFSITNYRDGAGWSSTFPDSLNASYSRAVNNAIVENMPTVTATPVFDTATLHVGQSTTARMSITNNSALYPVNLGYFGLGVGSPSGKNADLPFDTVTNLAPGATYNYAKTFTPAETGTYNARVSSTGDNGLTWSETLYPAAISPANNRLSVTVKSNPTLIQGMSITQNGSYVGDTATGTFSVKNFSNTAVTVNKKLCYIIRGPSNSNYDLGCLDVGVLNPGQTLVYTGTRTMSLAGQYNGFFAMYDGANWYNNWTFEKETGTEPTTTSFAVKDNPTIVQGLTLDNMTPRAGDTVTGNFQVRNNSLQSVTVNKSLCYIVRGPSNTNYDLGCLSVGTMTAGQTLTFSASRKINDAGQYNGFFAMYDGANWYNNWTFAKATGTEPTTLQFTAKSTPTLTQGLTISSPTSTVGSTVTGTFKVKNSSASAVTVNKKLCYIVRGPNSTNNDFGCLDVGTINPGQELTFTGNRTITLAGQYNGFFAMYDGANWYNNWTFEKETGTEPTTISFSAQ